MTRAYDNWERLVRATVRRQQLWQLCHDHSRTPSDSSNSNSTASAATSPAASTSPIPETADATRTRSFSLLGNQNNQPAAITEPETDNKPLRVEMGRIYDNWERLVEAVMRREQLRMLSLTDSRTTSSRSFDSDYSFSSSSWHDNKLSSRSTPSPLHPNTTKLKLANSINAKVPTKRRSVMWRSLSIFGGFSSSKKGNDKLANDRKTLYEKGFPTAEEANKRVDDIARLQEVYTLKGHIESVLKMKGLDINSIQHYYTI
ncbi:hypothetical protein CASFOL_023655 [Castilleja foliolosa]|uniref:Uncharacterized protein n=1 Tax=Castilleja foliolosa TaxID=1961234 RepID=A0ABD3CP23_9LAMI